MQVLTPALVAEEINVRWDSIYFFHLYRKLRTNIATKIKSEFQPQKSLVFHFDGKLLPSIDGSGRSDRLAITGINTEINTGDPGDHLDLH